MSAKYKASPPPRSEDQLSQPDKFREAARDLETDDDEKRFDDRLRSIAKKKDEKPAD